MSTCHQKTTSHPIFQALGNMWNRTESSEELVVKHQANEVAYMQGAANVGVRSMLCVS